MLLKQILVKKKKIDPQVGRPRITKEKERRIITLYLDNNTYRTISDKLNISIGTVHNYLSK